MEEEIKDLKQKLDNCLDKIDTLLCENKNLKAENDFLKKAIKIHLESRGDNK